MSLVVTAVGVAMGLAMGRWLSARRALRDAASARAKEEQQRDEGGATDPKKDAVPWDRFACRLGDVVVREDGAEAWLAGALVLSEDAPAAVLFVAPEAKADRAVLLFAKPSTDLYWLEPLPADAWKAPPSSDPPTSMEIGAEAFERLRRLPYRARREGEGAPDLDGDLILAEYKSMRNEEKRVIALFVRGRVRAWSGEKLDVGRCDVLPSGASTGAKSSADAT